MAAAVITRTKDTFNLTYEGAFEEQASLFGLTGMEVREGLKISKLGEFFRKELVLWLL